MNRRHFSARLAAGGLVLTALGGTGLARAQGKPVEGTHYVKLAQPVPVPPGKIEVVEFFWYGCPHCNAFEPLLETWIPRLPADVAFRRVPVAFRDEPFTSHQKIYYALEASLGLATWAAWWIARRWQRSSADARPPTVVRDTT